MKKSIIKYTLGMVAIISLFLACGEADIRSTQMLWSGSWMLVCFISGKAMTKYFDKEDLR